MSASHGVYRPGGSALNARQVGAARATQYIVSCCKENPIPLKEYYSSTCKDIDEEIRLGESTWSTQTDNIDDLWEKITKRMSSLGSAILSQSKIKDVLNELNNELESFLKNVKVTTYKQLN